jgi:4-hydroxythreonine-4-phosphate dehydrogenase
MTDWLIIADDLTGAADCAGPFAARGLDAVVAWGGVVGCNAAVLSVDADSRHLSAEAAAARQVAVQTARWRPGMRLYKKIDSTLRGQPATELAAQLSALRACADQPAPLAIVAPAFPATGRVTRGGRILLDDVPLEQTPLWAREHGYPNACLPDVLARAGLAAETIELAAVQLGRERVRARLEEIRRRGLAVVVCDATTESDLAIVAAASLQLENVVWVGSAGLACSLAAAVTTKTSSRPSIRLARGPVLVVVGSPSEVSRRQTRALSETQMVSTVVVRPEILLAGAAAPGWHEAVKRLRDGLAAGDALLQIAASQNSDLAVGAELAARLADVVEQVSASIGAIVVTGGETARAVLSRLGLDGMRLIDEVEPGVPLGVSIGARAIPLVTKAGAFGDAATLRRCVARLRDLGATGMAQ